MSGHLDDDVLVALSLTGAPGAPGAGAGAGEHLAGCAGCSSRLASFDRVVCAGRPETAGEPLQPPPHLWSRVAEEAGVPADPRALRPVRLLPSVAAPRARRRLAVVAAAATVAGMVLGGGAVWWAVGARGSAPDDGSPVAAAMLLPLSGTPASGQARLDGSGGVRRLVVDADLPGPSRGYYEVWLMDLSDGGLVSLGVLPAGTEAPLRLAVPADVDLGAYRTVDVSLERADGDPGHSGRSVLRGTLLPDA